MIVSVLVVILLLLVIFMAYREGRTYFNDPLKILVIVCVILLAILAFLPGTMGGVR